MALTNGQSAGFTVDRAVASALSRPRPDCPAAALSAFEMHLLDCARRHLATRPGYFLLSGLDHLSEPESRRFVQRVASMLGEPMQQDFAGDPVRDVVDRGTRLEATSTVRYSDTRHGGSLHTDGCHRLGQVPDLFTLLCVRQARSGGALVMVHVDDLLDRLGDRPGVLEAMRRPVHFDTRDDRTHGVPRTVIRPVVQSDGEVRIHYLREYIDSAHRRPEVPPLSAEQVTAFDMLDELLDREDLQTLVRLKPGEMIIVNNRSVIHGRTEFPAQDGPGGRLLLRVWIAGSDNIFGGTGRPPVRPADTGSAGPAQ